jgi:RNA polymerase sigma factor (sigma-70 family)
MTLALQGTPSIACDEHELVAAVRRGDDRAFEVLFSCYERRITAYVASMVGDHARAEDITQEAFMSALRRMRETDRPIAFKPWIYEIAKNACIDEFRRSRRSREVSFEEGDGSRIVARNVYVHAPAPEAAVESKQRLDDLCGAFGGLSESHHRVLVLRELEGLSYSEIGERLGMTRAMVESTLFRARRRLSDEYEELASGRRCARVQSLIESGSSQRLTSLGIRDRRELTRHLAHCQPCRRRARIGGIDESLLEPRRGLARLAALLPLPLPLLRWRRGGSSGSAVARSGSHSIAFAQSLPNVAQLVDPLGPSAALGRAAAAAAAIAIAGAGGGLVAGLDTGNRASRPVATASAAERLPVLSVTKILAPVNVRSRAVVVSPFAGVAPAAGEGGPSRPQNEPVSGGAGGIASGPAPVHSAGGGSGTSGPSATDHGGGASGSGGTGGTGGSSHSGTPAGSGGPPNGGISIPRGVQGSGPPSSPATTPPSPPAPPNGAPNVGGPVPSDPTGVVQGVQAPSTGSVQSTVPNAQPTATQTAGQVQQSIPPPPSSTAVGLPPSN